MHDRLVPRYVQEVEDLLHPLAGVQYQLFVGHHQTLVRPYFLALAVHRGYRVVPLDERLSIGGQVEARDGDLEDSLPRDIHRERRAKERLAHVCRADGGLFNRTRAERLNTGGATEPS